MKFLSFVKNLFIMVFLIMIAQLGLELGGHDVPANIDQAIKDLINHLLKFILLIL